MCQVLILLLNINKVRHSFWSVNHCHPVIAERCVDHNMFTLAKSLENTHLNCLNYLACSMFGLLLTKLHWLAILLQTISWTFYASQKLGSNIMTFYIWIKQFHCGLFTSVNLAPLGGEVVSRWFNHDKVMSSLPLPDQPSSELLVLKLCGPSPTTVAVLYRLPKPSNVFISELSSVLTTLCAKSPNIILMGD